MKKPFCLMSLVFIGFLTVSASGSSGNVCNLVFDQHLDSTTGRKISMSAKGVRSPNSFEFYNEQTYSTVFSRAFSGPRLYGATNISQISDIDFNLFNGKARVDNSQQAEDVTVLKFRVGPNELLYAVPTSRLQYMGSGQSVWVESIGRSPFRHSAIEVRHGNPLSESFSLAARGLSGDSGYRTPTATVKIERRHSGYMITELAVDRSSGHRDFTVERNIEIKTGGDLNDIHALDIKERIYQPGQKIIDTISITANRS